MHGQRVEDPYRNHGHQRNVAGAARRQRRAELDADELFAEFLDGGFDALSDVAEGYWSQRQSDDQVGRLS